MKKTINFNNLINTKIEITKEMSLSDVMPEGELIVELSDGTIACYMINSFMSEEKVEKFKNREAYKKRNGCYPDEGEKVNGGELDMISQCFEECENYNFSGRAWFMQA